MADDKGYTTNAWLGLSQMLCSTIVGHGLPSETPLTPSQHNDAVLLLLASGQALDQRDQRLASSVLPPATPAHELRAWKLGVALASMEWLLPNDSSTALRNELERSLGSFVVRRMRSYPPKRLLVRRLRYYENALSSDVIREPDVLAQSMEFLGRAASAGKEAEWFDAPHDDVMASAGLVAQSTARMLRSILDGEFGHNT